MRRVCQFQLYVPMQGVHTKNFRNDEIYGYGNSHNSLTYDNANLLDDSYTSFVEYNFTVAKLTEKRALIFS